MRKKVLILTSSFPDKNDHSKGVFIYNRIQQLLRNNIDVDVWVMNSILKGFMSNYVIKINESDIAIQVNVFNSIKIPRTYIWFGYNKIKEIVIKGQYELIHIHFAWDSWLACKISEELSIPYVITCHGSDIHTFPEKSKMFHHWTERFFIEASGVIFVSDYLKQLAISKGFNNPKTVVIPNGINLDNFKPCNCSDKDNNKVIYIGNLYKIKGADLLPAIIKESLKRLKDIDFLIVGNGPLKQSIEKDLVKEMESGKVTLLGSVSHEKIPSLLNEAKLLIIPSRKEGFSVAAIEARACGIPVVASSSGGLPSAVEDAGYLIDFGDDFEIRFSQSIRNALNEKWDKSLLHKKTSKFKWEKTIKQEISFYNEIQKKV